MQHPICCYKNKHNYKTKVNKVSASAKELLADIVTCYYVSKHIMNSTSKVNICHNQLLIECGSNGGVVGEDIQVRFTHPGIVALTLEAKKITRLNLSILWK